MLFALAWLYRFSGSTAYHDSIWEAGSLILEAGCAVGAQTKTVARQNAGSTDETFNKKIKI